LGREEFEVTRKVWVAAVAGLISLGLAGCGASQTAATANQLPSVPGLNLTEGDVAVRNLLVPYSLDGYPTGSDVPVVMSIFNESTSQQVRLVEVSSPLSSSVSIVDVTEVRYPVLPGQADPNAPVPEQQPEVTFAAGEFAHVTVQVSQVNAPVRADGGVPVELRFDNGVEFVVVAPIAPPLEPLDRAEPANNVGHH
jgi:copper(I)-binding protein